MTITIPPGRTIALTAKSGGGFQSVGVGSPSGADLANGQALRITGSGFGAVADPRPAAFDTFSDYAAVSAGNAIPTGTTWTTNGDTFHDEMIFDDQIKIPGRAFSAKTSTRKAKISDIIQYSGAPAKRADKYYMTFIARANEDIGTQPVGSESIALKWCRLGTDSKNQTRPTIEQRKQWTAIENDAGIFLCPGSSEFDETDVNNVPGCANDRYRYGLGVLGSPDTWVRIEVEVYSRTTARLMVNGQAILSGGDEFPYRKSPDDRDAIPLIKVLGTDVGTAADLNSTYRGWIAEVYEGVTPARVEFSNNPTYDPSLNQVRYYQRCSSRSDTVIEIDSAFFADLDLQSPVYAHVINDSGAEVATVELVVGTNVEII